MKNDATNFNRIMTGLGEVVEIVEGRAQAARIYVPEDMDVKAIRARLGLSQVAFAARFGFTASAVKEWEQHRRRPEAAARVLLRVIEREPEAVERAHPAPVVARSERTRSSVAPRSRSPPHLNSRLQPICQPHLDQGLPRHAPSAGVGVEFGDHVLRHVEVDAPGFETGTARGGQIKVIGHVLARLEPAVELLHTNLRPGCHSPSPHLVLIAGRR